MKLKREVMRRLQPIAKVDEFLEVSITHKYHVLRVCPILGPYLRGSPKLLARFLHILNGHAQTP